MAFTRPTAAQINFDLVNLTDPLIRLNSGETGSADKDAGFVIERGNDTNVGLIYDESADSFALINTDEIGTTAGNVTIASYADLTLKKVTQSEQQYTTSNMMKFNQYYLGNASGSYFTNGEYQKVLTIIPAGNSENYQVRGTISAQNAGETHVVTFNAALRSGDPLPDLSWSIQYTEQYNGSRYIDPQLWTKETSTAGFIFAFKTLGTIYGNVTVDIDVIPRSSGLKSNVTMNNTVSSEQAGVDSGYTANDMSKVFSIIADDFTVAGTLTAAGNVEVTGNLSVSGTTTTVDVNSINITNSFTFEGATPDGNETKLTVVDPTADRTITLPNATGTVALTANVLALAGGTMSGAIALGTNRITGVGDPVGSQDVVTKAYFDANTSSFSSNASGFSNSTFITVPGAVSFDLVKQQDQSGDAETPFVASGGLDAFGVSLSEVYDMMEPIGKSTTTDLGALS